MLQWLARGLRLGRITTRYPARPEPAPPGYRGAVRLLEPSAASTTLPAVCPTGAITVDGDRRVRLDRARCILCGDCVRADPARFAFEARYETAAGARSALVAGDGGLAVAPVRRALGDRSSMLRRSIHVRHIDCGSDGSEEWEIQALWNPYYDIQRLGFFLTAAPRHADVLLVTGAVTDPMRAPLERTWQVMPEPKALIAVGSEACSAALTGPGGLTAGGVDAVLPVDVYVPGSPPAPIAIMHGLLLAIGVLRGHEKVA
jgi:Ni,Fe-hydrogenase III small subunit/ferredoxin